MSFLALAGSLQSTDRGASAPLSHGFELRVDVLEDWLVRVAVLPASGLEVDRGWMIAPEGEVPWQGRDRLDAAGFTATKPQVDIAARSITGTKL